mgnify:CR=1 FL=1
MPATYLHVIVAPEDFDWEDEDDQLLWELPPFPSEDEGDTEAGSMAEGHISRQLKFLVVDNGVVARSLNERNFEPRFEAPQLY